MFVKQLSASVLKLIFSIKVLRPHYFGVHKRIIEPLNLFRGVTRTINFDHNLKLHLAIEDWIPQQLYLLGTYEEKELRFVTSQLNEGDLFVDIGANIGLFTLVASRIVGSSGRVVSFEPALRNYNKLVHHISTNNISNVIAEKLAISSGESSITLKGGEDSFNSGMISEFGTDTGHSELVSTTSLDRYRHINIDGKIKFIKIDIEGGEYNALQGMQEILSADRPMILMELNDNLLNRAGSSAKAIEDFLDQFKYVKRFLDGDGRIVKTRMLNDDSFNCVFLPQ